MTAHARTKYVRVSPRKARLVATLIRGLDIESAFDQLHCNKSKAKRFLQKTLKSAVANAENNHGDRRENLKVKEVRVDEGPSLKRSKPIARGGKHLILKRTSHITIVVGE